MVDQPPVCDYEGSDYQSAFWDAGSREYEDQAEQVALRRLLPPSGKLLLELGAGAGRNTPRYRNFEKIVLLDYSRTQLREARRRLGDSERFVYVAANIYCLPFVAGLFDTATMIRTLHHMADAPLAIEQVRRALIPGAVFVLEYANKQNLKAILRWILHRQEWNPFNREPVEFAKLNFDFHPAAVQDWLQAKGFKIERSLTVSHFRMQPLKRMVPTRLLVALDSMAQLTGNLWQLTPSVFVRAEAVGATPKASPQEFFCCPECRTGLPAGESEFFDCRHCGRQWGKQDGIYDFREPL